jgi:hypothetical protein
METTMSTQQNGDHVPPLDEITTQGVYPLEAFRTRTGLSVDALRECRKKGLKIVRLGKRSWVFGEDWIAYLRKHGRAYRLGKELQSK